MKRFAAIGLFCLAASNSHSAPVPPRSTLRWENGESVSGELLEASDADLTWKTPLFEDPLLLRWPVVRRLDQSLPPSPFTDPFDFALRDGSRLHGELKSIGDDVVSIRSSRHGDVDLKRSQVLCIRRVHGGNLVAAGPDGDVGWLPLPKTENEDRGSKPSDASGAPFLTLGAGGALSMPYWNCGASFAVTLPELVDIEFCVRSSNRPDFQFLAKGGPGQDLAVETWDDELVLTVGDEFKSIRKIASGERTVEMRLCWNLKERKCTVFSTAGELITEWQVPAGSGPGNKLVLHNKGRDLSLELLCIRPWDGRAPAKVNASQPRVELADGTIIEGQVDAGSDDSISVQSAEPGSKTTVPFAAVQAIVFSAEAVRPAPQEAVFSYADGTRVGGRIDWIKNGWAALVTAFSDQAVLSKTSGLRQLLLDHPLPPGPVPEKPFARMDQLVADKTTLHGALTCDGSRSPRWLPVGGVRPATLAGGLSIEITRSRAAEAEIPPTPALFYTTVGDVLPGNLVALDRSGAEFESGIVTETKLPAASLDAIQFRAAVRTEVHGFGDPGWRIVKGDEKTVRLTGSALGMDPETSFGHPSIMQSSEIKFKVPPSSFSFVRLRMFCSGTDGKRSTNLILGSEGNRLCSGLETTEGQMDDQTQTPVPTNQPVDVRLVIEEKNVDLHVNGALVETFPIESKKQAGFGLVIEPAGLWGNPIQPISLSDFSSASDPGRTWTPDVNPAVKAEALTVPRAQRDSPPRHALLAANGDVLRGEIEAITPSHLGFRSGLEDLRVPRDRVKAVLMLKKPSADSPPPEKDQPVLKILDQRLEMRRGYGGATLDTLVQALQQEAEDLKVKLPAKKSNRTYQMQFGGQTVGQALDKICAMARLRYHVDDEGVVVLEELSDSKALVQKTYWLRTAAFPAAQRARDALGGKGIAFPDGSAVTWQPDAKQLSVVNTAENQGKISALLESQFGGLAQAPTHWLLLTNGARIGLTVDAFAEDSITGSHPLYGRCNVPISQVYVVRNSAPEPTATMRSMQGWRLVVAPEPVIPEAGADASSDLGKDAKPFKLPLLGGGEFDLAKRKGKVVVLDFWATWCGPCVKALPGLIEAMSAFPPDRVELVGLNQSEPEPQVKRFLETRGWKLTVALDAGQAVGRQYGVDGIPHTVIVGPDGKIAWVKTGYTPDGETEAAEAVKKLLAPSSPGAPSPAIR